MPSRTAAPRKFLTISELASHLGTTTPKLRDFMIGVGLIEKVFDDFYKEFRFEPTDKAGRCDPEIVRKKPRTRAGRYQTRQWRVAYVVACWRNSGRDLPA